MICKIFNQGTGLSSPIIKYLLSEEKHKGFKPEIVQGNPDITKFIIDNSTAKNKYITGVLSFKKGENLTEEQQLELIDRFQKAFAPFDEAGRVNFLWIKHFDKGRLELHFLMPRKDLKTNKAFNIHPPGKANLLFFESFVRITNLKYGFEQSDKKPMTAKDLRFYTDVFIDLRQKRKEYLKLKFDAPKKIKYSKTKGLKNGSSRKFTNSNSFSNVSLVSSRKYYGSNNAITKARTTDDSKPKNGNKPIENISQYAFNTIKEHTGRTDNTARDTAKSSTFVSSALSINDQLYALGLALNTCSPAEYDSIKARIDYLWFLREQKSHAPKPKF